MKKIFISILAGIALLTLSCTDELEQHNKGQLTDGNFFKTEADATAAVDGIYAILVHSDKNMPLYGGQILYLNDLAADYMTVGSNNSPETSAIAYVTYGASNFEIQCTWEQLYKGIARANTAIENIPNVTASDEVKQRLINEAKFLRALFYFNAVQFFGEIPLIKTTADAYKPLTRNAVNDVYDFIIEDLEDAQALPLSFTGSNTGRATTGAAKALLARVYLVRSSLPRGTNTWEVSGTATEDLNNAVKYAYEVINGNQYELFSNFYDAFDPAKKNGKEHIFSAQYTYGQQGGTAGNASAHCTWSTGFNHSLPVLITSNVDKFYNTYAAGDQRRKGSYAKQLNYPAKSKIDPSKDSIFIFDVPRFRKFIDTTVVLNWMASAINTDIIRLADVYFTLAEALNELSGPDNAYNGITAYDALNEIRRRAFREGKYSADGTAPAAHDLSGLDQASFRETLQQERYFEFVTEQTRWFDLVRWKKLVQSYQGIVGKEQASHRNYRFPIPQAERNLNPEGLWQNYGYDGAKGDKPYYYDYN
ncbi:MAG: RagB/SusD family nutrient uptake outer membrane protein [Prevotellaceae bacterium]|jgi:hypothetical protein|nr:RagB/SusD family nutrient uptake outer membrane protein [Prevotellaceae bacterium]